MPTMQEIDDELTKSFESLRILDLKMQQNFQKTMSTLKDFEKFSRDASDTIDYYFSIQSTYNKKEDFLGYLNKILNIYVMYLCGDFDEEDEEIENIIEFIEDNYDCLIYFREKINPVYRRINDPEGCSIRKQLNKSEKKRLAGLLL